MRAHRRQFSEEFKRDAVRQVTDGGKTAAEVARRLGIRGDQVRRWKRLAGGGAVPSARREELRRVRREIARLRAELAILERAAAVLAQDGLTVA
jgi:transposase